MKIRLNIAILSLAFLTQCNQSDIEDLRKETPVMIAIVPNGNETSGIQLFYLEEGTGPGTPITDATLTMTHNATLEDEILLYDAGDYRGDLPIEANSTYTLTGSVKSQAFTTEITLPPAIEFMIPPNDTLIVDATSTGSTIFISTWTALDNELYSYVVRLQCLEDNPVEIPFSVPSGNFSSNFSGPQVAAGIIVSDTDFKYYGKHAFTVFAIPKALEKIYFYSAGDIRGLLTNGPDNILGIKGFATGVSRLEGEVFLKPL